MRDVAVIGVGHDQVGRALGEVAPRPSSSRPPSSPSTTRASTTSTPCTSAACPPGCSSARSTSASLLADYLGRGPVPATRVESACASGGLALRHGFLEVASGVSDIVLVGGVEKMTDVAGGEATYALGTAADQEYEGFHGVTFPGLYAMMAVAHMHRYGTTREQLAVVAVKNHANGSMNPLAQFPFKVTVEQVLDSVLVADPLHILDCSPITDGAAAVVLGPVEMARSSRRSRSSGSPARATPPTRSP